MTDQQTEAPAAAAKPPVTVELSEQDVRDFGVILDAAVRQAGYSAITAAALRIGGLVAFAVQKAAAG